MSDKPCKFFHNLIKLTDLFDPDYDRDQTFSASSDGNKYHIVDGDDDIGVVLLFDMSLRDGPIVVFVDDSGHTEVIDTFKKAKQYKNCYLAKTTEEYQGINKIYAEFKNNFYGPYYEIYKLRKRLTDNGLDY